MQFLNLPAHDNKILAEQRVLTISTTKTGKAAKKQRKDMKKSGKN
jgi:hypothetical protein